MNKIKEIQEACAKAAAEAFVGWPSCGAEQRNVCAAAIRSLKFEDAKPVAYESTNDVSGELRFGKAPINGPWTNKPLGYTTPQPCPRCAELDAERKRLIKLDQERFALHAADIEKIATLEAKLAAANCALQESGDRATTIAALEAESKSIRTLMNCYNVGGWTDSLGYITELQATIAQQAKSIAYWKADSAAAWDKCEERRKENEQQAERIKELEKHQFRLGDMRSAEVGILQEKLAAAEKGACALWMMLDDIDTGGDIAKADDVLYRAIAERSHKRRFDPRFEWVIKAIDAAIAEGKK